MSLTFVRPRVAFAATLGLALCLVTGTVMAALAAPAATLAAAPKDPPVTGTVAAVAIPQTPIDTAPICSKTRRKLWVEGEGWIVRRVYAC